MADAWRGRAPRREPGARGDAPRRDGARGNSARGNSGRGNSARGDSERRQLSTARPGDSAHAATARDSDTRQLRTRQLSTGQLGTPRRWVAAATAPPRDLAAASPSPRWCAPSRAGSPTSTCPRWLGRTQLSDRDRAWVTGAVYGTLRRQRYLDDLIAPHSKRTLGELEPGVRAALRLGAYQLVDGVAPHAARRRDGRCPPERARTYVNGVLRSLDRHGRPWPEPIGLGQRLSYPDWIVDELVSGFGEADGRAALEAMNEPGAVTLRVNPLRADRTAVLRELELRGASTTPGMLLPDAIVVVGTGDLERLRSVREGRVTPQDQASQAVVSTLDPQAGERVLDIASAPGGKTSAIAERMGDNGVVIATDLHASRLRLVREASGRLQLMSVHALVASGAALPCPDATFDRVLLDAPCSGLGVLRRRPEARWRVEPRQLAAARRVADLVARARRDEGASRRPPRLLGVHADPSRDARGRRMGRAGAHRLRCSRSVCRAVAPARSWRAAATARRRHRRHVRAGARS